MPVVVKVNHVGAIFMSENITASSKTRHINIQAKHVNQMVDDKMIVVEFVKSSDNWSDPMTKNANGELHEAHTGSYCMSWNDINNPDAILTVNDIPGRVSKGRPSRNPESILNEVHSDDPYLCPWAHRDSACPREGSVQVATGNKPGSAPPRDHKSSPHNSKDKSSYPKDNDRKPPVKTKTD